MSYVSYSLQNHIARITLTHPKVNVLSQQLIQELNTALDQAETDPEARVIILAGQEKAFAAGADIAEVHHLTTRDFLTHDFVEPWQHINRCKKPIIAEIQGFCLGGGFELALMCDIIVAADNARFGQPEITIGTLPGSGATQRLTALMGKGKAMELCLTGKIITAKEALEWGLIHHCVTRDQLMDTTHAIAQTIAQHSQPVVKMIKSLVKAAAENHLQSGLQRERELFHATFDLDDQKEGMQAFLDKRKPLFKDS